MKDILGLVIVIIGSSIFGRGFKMLSPELQSKFAKEMHEKQSVQPDELEYCDNNHHYIKGDDPAICSCGKLVRR